ncbi:hypothetical protein DFJ74DRAFT_32641 [Hyaloraphidium curvatum]|nr:hypothetical protein DFJ74DRAFT_32641 [Hyaloraphidium curvatum]
MVDREPVVTLSNVVSPGARSGSRMRDGRSPDVLQLSSTCVHHHNNPRILAQTQARAGSSGPRKPRTALAPASSPSGRQRGSGCGCPGATPSVVCAPFFPRPSLASSELVHPLLPTTSSHVPPMSGSLYRARNDGPRYQTTGGAPDRSVVVQSRLLGRFRKVRPQAPTTKLWGNSMDFQSTFEHQRHITSLIHVATDPRLSKTGAHGSLRRALPLAEQVELMARTNSWPSEKDQCILLDEMHDVVEKAEEIARIALYQALFTHLALKLFLLHAPLHDQTKSPVFQLKSLADLDKGVVRWRLQRIVNDRYNVEQGPGRKVPLDHSTCINATKGVLSSTLAKPSVRDDMDAGGLALKEKNMLLNIQDLSDDVEQ